MDGCRKGKCLSTDNKNRNKCVNSYQKIKPPSEVYELYRAGKINEDVSAFTEVFSKHSSVKVYEHTLRWKSNFLSLHFSLLHTLLIFSHTSLVSRLTLKNMYNFNMETLRKGNYG